MKITIIISLIIFCLPFLIFCDFNINKCWINPNGWKLPDLQMFKKTACEIKNCAGKKEPILVERYKLKDGINYSLYDKKCEPKKRNRDEIRILPMQSLPNKSNMIAFKKILKFHLLHLAGFVLFILISFSLNSKFNLSSVIFLVLFSLMIESRYIRHIL